MERPRLVMGHIGDERFSSVAKRLQREPVTDAQKNSIALASFLAAAIARRNPANLVLSIGCRGIAL
jgi:hypothetical protein